MSDLVAAAVLGLVEGLTEFLPISSTGHLIVASDLLGFTDPAGVFEIVIQLGAVLAVVWFYRRELLARTRALAAGRRAWSFWGKLFVAFLPAAVAGLALEHWIIARLFSPRVVAVSLAVGGCILWAVEIRLDRRGRGAEQEPAEADLDRVGWGQAIAVGVAQVTALVPGVSRSGASIVGGLLAGLDRPTATAFSFYLALPTLGGATVYSLLEHLGEIDRTGRAGVFLVGTAVAFATALVAIGWLLRYVSRHDFRAFAYYRIGAGALLLAWLALGR